MDKELDDIIKLITSSDEYKKCLEIKSLMSKNEEITGLIDEIKKLQKEYVKSNSDDIKDKLEVLNNRLFSIPIYSEYIKYLDIVNSKIDYIRDDLNIYFDKLLNSENI